MKILLKIVLLPITLALNILLGISKFVLVFGGGLLGVLSFVFFALGIGIIIVASFSQAISCLYRRLSHKPVGIADDGSMAYCKSGVFQRVAKRNMILQWGR